MPKVSIIIPTYNHSQYVIRAINSSLNQTYKDFEIIVVDDGSTDNTKQVLDPYHKKIKYIYQGNKGLAGARNTGIKASTGEYLQFLDADDEILPTKLEFQVEIMEKHPEIDITACGWNLLDKEGSPLIDPREYNKEIIEIEDVIYATPFVVEVLMFRRECFSNVGLFDEDMRFCEDIDMWLRLAAQGYKFYCYSSRLVNVYRISGSMSCDNPFNITKYHLKVLDKFFTSSDLKPEIRALKEQAYFNEYRSCAWNYYSSGRLNEGRKYLIEMIKIIPGILAENKFFYQLDNFFKPFGYATKKTTLKDFKIIEKEIFNLLNELYNKTSAPEPILSIKKRVYSNAYLGISIRYFEFRKTRKFLVNFLKAFILSQDFVLHSIWVHPHLKALLGPFLVLIIKGLRKLLCLKIG